MFFRGGRGGRRGGGRDGGFGGGRGGGRGRGRSFRDEGPPTTVLTAGRVVHECEAELVCQWVVEDKVPMFNAGIYLANKRKIGKLDEVLGKIVSDTFFTVKLDAGMVSSSFQKNDPVYMAPEKMMPLQRFTDPNKPGGRRGGGGRSPGRAGRGGRGFRGGGGRGGGRFSSGGRSFRGGGRGRSGFGRGRGRGRQ